MIRTTAAIAALALVAAAASPFLSSDLSDLRPEATKMHAELAGCGVDLAAAIGVAEATVKGKVKSAEVDPATKTTTLEVFNATKCVSIVIGVDGKVISRNEIPRFPGAPVRGSWTETDSGLRYFDLKIGDGEQPAGPTTRVRVHYTGYLVDGTKFDSSVDRGKPADFALNRVIPGWTEGVGSMKVGGKRKLILPAKLGYGPRGQGPIPGGATLIFDVELIEILL
jgi:hypothetical protein